MATKKPRITITISESQHQLLKTISEASGSPMSYLVTDLIQASEPILERTATSFSHLKELNDENKRKIKFAMENAQSIIEPMAVNALHQMDVFIDTMNEIHGASDHSSPFTNRGDTTTTKKHSKPAVAKVPKQVSKEKIFKRVIKN